MAGADGFLADARRVDSPNFDARPAGAAVTLLVVHAISLPPGQFGGDAIERLFTNRLDHGAHPSFGPLSGLRVSAHFLLRRDGELVQFVAAEQRAWHAGASCWRGRGACNDFSIGIELEGDEVHPFGAAQYAGLAALVTRLRRRFPLRDIAGHEDVAPQRKRDPGPHFDWPRLLRALAQQRLV
ncbi:MAG: 1,6-anhydro-N-acetylmuramyl-L-alanine amidase AmpD [Burkholderiales bacterium]|nr:1,6-anhydro-N-acetylmuramyl-L-alanine amidase AmpD [Burkholderiales bacterium]